MKALWSDNLKNRINQFIGILGNFAKKTQINQLCLIDP